MERHHYTLGQLGKESQIAAIRQAEALEHLVVLAEAIAKKMGVTVPERLPPPVEEAPKEESFNPYTESAPGVPLEGQEAPPPVEHGPDYLHGSKKADEDDPKKGEKHHASKSS